MSIVRQVEYTSIKKSKEKRSNVGFIAVKLYNETRPFTVKVQQLSDTLPWFVATRAVKFNYTVVKMQRIRHIVFQRRSRLRVVVAKLKCG